MDNNEKMTGINPVIFTLIGHLNPIIPKKPL